MPLRPWLRRVAPVGGSLCHVAYPPLDNAAEWES